jgi:hypothetical protein
MLFVIPLFYYGAANGSHDFLAVTFSAVVWGYWLFTGVPFDPILTGVTLWFTFSVAWSTHYGNSIHNLLIIFALFTVMIAVQSVDKFLVMLFSFIPAVGMAGLELYQRYKKHENDRRGALFGNVVHAGVYYATNLFIGLWMTYNISIVFLPFCILLLLGVFTTQCRGAILSVCVGMGVVLFHELGTWVTIFICSCVGILTILTQKFPHYPQYENAKLCS